MVNIREVSQQKTDEIVSYVLEKVNSGVWQAGHRMPTERHFIQQFSAARNTVRKALTKLQSDDVIVKYVGRGTFIKSDEIEAVAQADELTGLDPSPAEVNEIRILLEPAIAELVATRATASDIEYAKKCLSNSLKAKAIEDYEWWDAELHSTIIRASKNNMVIYIYQAIHRARQQIEWTEIKRKSMNEERFEQYDMEHARIVDAFANRDAIALREALKTHLQSVSHNMLNPKP
ncbi:FCD domain-containing protein [Pseudomonadales bacterium]|nr:FCD domain-containing protein [Pseudomonadales bacterium]